MTHRKGFAVLGRKRADPRLQVCGGDDVETITELRRISAAAGAIAGVVVQARKRGCRKL